MLVAGSGEWFDNGEVKVWEVSTGELLHTIADDCDAVDFVTYSPSSQDVAVVTGSGCGPRDPVQPNVPGHDPAALKSRFGKDLAFFGAIDQQDLLPHGTPEEIARDVKAVIEILGEGGGYMVAPAHIIQADTSPGNVEAFIAAAKEHGQYR